MAASPEAFDVSARKFHQYVCVALLAGAYVLAEASAWLIAAVSLVAFVGFVLLAGRFWWPADVFRQLAWRVLEPSGLLRRYDAVEDHSTRRVARVLGGALLLAAAGLLAAGHTWPWVIVAAIGVMIFLDAAFNFCVLCEITYRFGRMKPIEGMH